MIQHILKEIEIENNKQFIVIYNIATKIKEFINLCCGHYIFMDY